LSKIRSDDRSLAILSVALNPIGRDLAWDFLREHWDEYNSNGNYLPASVIAGVSQFFSHELRYQELETFFQKHKAVASERTIQQSLERIRNNIYFVDYHMKVLCRYLINNFN